jgi:hypothetical protein
LPSSTSLLYNNNSNMIPPLLVSLQVLTSRWKWLTLVARNSSLPSGTQVTHLFAPRVWSGQFCFIPHNKCLNRSACLTNPEDCDWT